VRAKLGRLLCHLGRHDREYLIGHNDRVVVWCLRCRNVEAFEAKRLPGPVPATTDRPMPPTFGSDAAGLLKAVSITDVEAINVLGKHVDDPVRLVLSLCWLIGDALGHPASDDLPAYAERVFERLDRGQAP
jgi:hypothetical protein